jgi:hypothetical protein
LLLIFLGGIIVIFTYIRGLVISEKFSRKLLELKYIIGAILA